MTNKKLAGGLILAAALSFLTARANAELGDIFQAGTPAGVDNNEIRVDGSGNLSLGASATRSTITAAGAASFPTSVSAGTTLTANTNLTVQGNSSLGAGTTNTLTITGSSVTIGARAVGLRIATATTSNFPILLVDGTNLRVGVGKQAPSQALDVSGNQNLEGNLTAQGNATLGAGTTNTTTISGSATTGTTLAVGTALTVNTNETVQGDSTLGAGTTNTVTTRGISYVSAQQLYTSSFTSVGYLSVVSSETITTGGTITANACGGTKVVYAASAIATSTTNTFTAPAAANTGCTMKVCATTLGGNLTLDNNALFKSAGAADVVLTSDDCIDVTQIGTVWVQVSALLAN